MESASGRLVVAIDGPAGVGKSTVARRLARRLGVPYLDTGAMYRTLALAALQRGIDPDDRERVLEMAREVRIGLMRQDDGGVEVLLDGEPVGERIRTPEVSAASSRVSTYPEVRERLVALQRACGAEMGAVMEGRDIGTQVFPETPYKFFLVARADERHRRRFDQLRGAGATAELEAVAAEMTERDARDAGRSVAPLVRARGAAEIDTSDLTPDEVVDRMVEAIAGRRA